MEISIMSSNTNLLEPERMPIIYFFLLIPGQMSTISYIVIVVPDLPIASVVLDSATSPTAF